MSIIYAYQIYYSEQTRDALDPGFLPLDNLANPRPDWREYWPMRKFLIEQQLDEQAYYGFFSPKFKQKTTLDAGALYDFVRAQPADTDVVLFSPFFDQSAFPLNIFEQGLAQHVNIAEVFEETLRLLAPQVNINNLLMDARNTVFCNYFVARPAFWRRWLEQCEKVFAIGEANDTRFGQLLNGGTTHDGGLAPNKVFVTERVASLILATEPQWRVQAYNPMLMPFTNAGVARFPNELVLLDSLKIAARDTGYGQYLNIYYQLRNILMQNAMAPQAPAPHA
jgi:hypothetical protein